MSGCRRLHACTSVFPLLVNTRSVKLLWIAQCLKMNLEENQSISRICHLWSEKPDSVNLTFNLYWTCVWWNWSLLLGLSKIQDNNYELVLHDLNHNSYKQKLYLIALMKTLFHYLQFRNENSPQNDRLIVESGIFPDQINFTEAANDQIASWPKLTVDIIRFLVKYPILWKSTTSFAAQTEAFKYAITIFMRRQIFLSITCHVFRNQFTHSDLTLSILLILPVSRFYIQSHSLSKHTQWT